MLILISETICIMVMVDGDLHFTIHWYYMSHLSQYKTKKRRNPLLYNLLCRYELRRQDSNVRPPGYEPGELPTAPLRDVLPLLLIHFWIASAKVLRFFESAKQFGEKYSKIWHYWRRSSICRDYASVPLRMSLPTRTAQIVYVAKLRINFEGLLIPSHFKKLMCI